MILVRVAGSCISGRIPEWSSSAMMILVRTAVSRDDPGAYDRTLHQQAESQGGPRRTCIRGDCRGSCWISHPPYINQVCESRPDQGGLQSYKHGLLLYTIFRTLPANQRDIYVKKKKKRWAESSERRLCNDHQHVAVGFSQIKTIREIKKPNYIYRFW